MWIITAIKTNTTITCKKKSEEDKRMTALYLLREGFAVRIDPCSNVEEIEECEE